jgi:hypothetical protein
LYNIGNKGTVAAGEGKCKDFADGFSVVRGGHQCNEKEALNFFNSLNISLMQTASEKFTSGFKEYSFQISRSGGPPGDIQLYTNRSELSFLQ